MSNKRNTYTLTIDTPNGTINAPVHHSVNENDYNMQTTVTVTMQGKQLCFEAETTEKALISFAKSLPAGWHIRSCLSCRYGHFCPVGNADNELFCVTEFEPKVTDDLWHVTEDDEERSKRSRNLFHLCDHYLPQSDDYFTYNDYYLVMKNH
ncbi:MAG: hypothetical protein IJY39_10225 [Clostridia bacterium]|nr:hypothetical protein [Clostridia bacterium]